MRRLVESVQQCNEWDRFIPLRRAVTASNFRYGVLINVNRQKDILEQDTLNVNEEEYQKLLEIALGLEGKTARIYRFQRATTINNEIRRKFQWAVRPRKRPLIEKPSVVLDLPDLKACFNHNLLDWGSEYLAAALHTTVFIWKAGKEKGMKLTRVMPGYCSSLKWSNIGNLLAIGTTCGMVQIWCEKKLTRFFVCNHYSEEDCEVNTFAWHPYVNDLVSGCSKGRIGVYEKCRFIDAHESQVLALRFSPDGAFLASSGGDTAVRLWQWPLMLPYMEIMGESDEPIRALAWHPWYTSYLVIGDAMSGSVTLWNVRLCRLLATAQLGEVKVNGLEFNRISGELVVNIWKPGSQDEQSSNGHSAAVVLASFDDVVDRMDFNTGVVFQIMWDSSGRQLAAVGDDEMLRIWDFFGPLSRRSETDCFRSLLMPLFPSGFKIPQKNGVKLYNGIVCYFEDKNKKHTSPSGNVHENSFGCSIR